MDDVERPHGVWAGDALLLTPEEAATLLRVGRTTVYALMKSGELQPVHIGRSCRLSRAELERYVRRLEAPEPVPPRRRPRKATPANQGDLFALCSNPVDEASAVDSHPRDVAPDHHTRRGRRAAAKGTR